MGGRGVHDDAGGGPAILRVDLMPERKTCEECGEQIVCAHVPGAQLGADHVCKDPADHVCDPKLLTARRLSEARRTRPGETPMIARMRSEAEAERAVTHYPAPRAAGDGEIV